MKDIKDLLTAIVHMHTALSRYMIWFSGVPLGESQFGAIRPKPFIFLKG